MTGSIGIIKSTDYYKREAIVTLINTETNNDSVRLLFNEICKFFVIGNHVKIIRGNYNGETGTVIFVETKDGQDTIIVHSDSYDRDMKVSSLDAEISEEVNFGQVSSNGYSVYDLVGVYIIIMFY